jgi:hypothetical protein
MAELGRARPVIVAAIATILTANIAILSADRAQAEHAVAVAVSTTQAAAAPPDFVVFGKTDTPVAAPTMFAVRRDGTELMPSSQPAVLPPQQPTPRVAWSHDGAFFATVREGDAGDELWVVPRPDGDPRLLTHFAPLETSFCGRNGAVRTRLAQPMWSSDDRYIAFLSNANHLAAFGASFDIDVVDVEGGNVVTAYRAPRSTCERVDASQSAIMPAEFLSLVGWSKSANMAA